MASELTIGKLAKAVGVNNEAPRSKLRGITELNFEDFSEAEANPVASYGECSSSNGQILRATKTAEPDGEEAIRLPPLR